MKRVRMWAVLFVVLAAVVGLSFVSQTTQALIRYCAEPTEMVVPVEGVAPKSVSSSWGAARSGHRRHEGVDIFARRGTPVLSATAGEVVRIGNDRLGGKVVWVAGQGANLYYYAHLDAFQPGLAIGDSVVPGSQLGVVGDTGNARGTPPHLHFGIYPAAYAFRAIDPVPYLHKRAHQARRAL